MAKKIGIGVLIVLVLVAVGVGVFWARLTALPAWYEDPAMIAEDGSPQVDPDWVQIPEAEAPKGAPAGAEVYVLRNPHLRSDKAKSGPVESAIKRSRASYAGGQLEAGAVLNLNETDRDKLSSKEREQLEEVLEAFPALAGRDVYVGLEGGVAGADGKLALGPKTKLRVGKTSYTLKSAAKRLGMSEGELRKEIEKGLAKMDVELPPS